MKLKNKITTIALASVLGLAGAVHGQIALYEFGPDGSDSIGTANMTAGDFTVGGTATSFGSNTTFGSDFADEPYARLNGNWEGASAALGGYGTFTLTPASGFQFEVTTFTFEVSATNSGPDTIAAEVGGVLYDDLQTSFQGTDATFVSISIGTTFTSATEFRVIGYGGGTGNMDMDSPTVNGSVSAVPEPSAYALLAGLLGLGYVMVRRRRA